MTKVKISASGPILLYVHEKGSCTVFVAVIHDNDLKNSLLNVIALVFKCIIRTQGYDRS